MIRLGVNIDHIATIRQARGEPYPDPVQAALLCELGGADNITAHLREDRRHIQDHDVRRLRETIKIPLNLEIAATSDMVQAAIQFKPHAVTLVPERRLELTTEGGLDFSKEAKPIAQAVQRFKALGILVSLFIEPDLKAVDESALLGVDAIEFHTGKFCHTIDSLPTTRKKLEVVDELARAAEHAANQGLQVHLGHGLHYGNAHWLQKIPFAEEANIGHAIVSRAVFVGLESAVREMKRLLNDSQCRP